jgi:hypothetical protein
MDPQVSTSFIPKKPLAESPVRRRRGTSLFYLLALLIFIASVVAAGGAFVYGRYLTASLDSKKDQLEKYQASFDLPTIQALIRFDSRLTQARMIIGKHIAPSAIFSFLSQQTLEKVQFKNFDYLVGDADHPPTITLTGVADSFATIALQSDQFGNSKVLKDIIFSDISIQGPNKVAFSVKASVDPALILYSNSYAAAQQAPTIVPAGSSTPLQ